MISIKLRRFFASILCVALLMGAFSSLGTTAFPFIAYTTNSLRLLQKPAASADTVFVIPANDAVTVTGSDGNFYIIEYSGLLGYGDKRDLTSTAPGPQGAKAVAAAIPLAATADQTAKYPALMLDSEGPAVKALQQALEELGFLKSKIDSKYGANTAQSVRNYQKKINCLPMASPTPSARKNSLKAAHSTRQAVPPRCAPCRI